MLGGFEVTPQIRVRGFSGRAWGPAGGLGSSRLLLWGFGVPVGWDQGFGVTLWGFKALYELLGSLLGDKERGWGLELKGGAWGIILG